MLPLLKFYDDSSGGRAGFVGCPRIEFWESDASTDKFTNYSADPLSGSTARIDDAKKGA
jgi:hypothetical protein